METPRTKVGDKDDPLKPESPLAKVSIALKTSEEHAPTGPIFSEPIDPTIELDPASTTLPDPTAPASGIFDTAEVLDIAKSLLIDINTPSKLNPDNTIYHPVSCRHLNKIKSVNQVKEVQQINH